MKSFAFAAALVAATQAVELEWGYSQPSYSYKPVVSYSQAAPVKAASKAQGADYARQYGSDFDAYGRDQDLSIDEGYGKTNAKSYRAESYDEWDNKNNDTNGAQAWGKDRDAYGQSSYNQAASKNSYDGYGYGGKAGYGYGNNNGYGYAGAKGQGYGNEKMADASASQGAAKGGYDNDEWAKQAYAQDTDSRWGKSYDSVDAKNYDNEWYERSVWADDDQWAEDYDKYDKRSADSYGAAASTNNGSYGYGGYGKGGVNKASAQGAAGSWGKSASDFDAWGRDQDFKETVRYDNTRAKAYSAESYDEWDNEDNDKYGAQAWGKDRDVYGASSYGKDASSADYGSYGKGGAAYGGYGQSKGYGGYGKGGYASSQGSYGKAGYGGKDSVWKGASWEGGQQQAGYDNDEWAKQAYGQDYDSRWGKSYDRVSAKSYENEQYDRELWADDDQWAEDYDQYESRDADSYGKAASASYGKAGYGGYGYGGYGQAASKAGAAGYDSRSGSDFDAWGRDQDLSVKESYDQTWAKSYEAESYDEWDNKDNDKYGSQGWGKDRDAYASSSYGKKASEGDYDSYGKAGNAYAQGSNAYGGYSNGGYGGYGNGYGHGYGKSYGGSNAAYGSAAYGGYGADKAQGASASSGAAKGAYDNDAWAKQAYAQDTDSRWGKSYDFVEAKNYDDEQYKRQVRADDDEWAEDYDRWSSKDADSYGKAASSAYQAPAQKHVSYQPVKSYGGYNQGYGNGYGNYGGYGGQSSYGNKGGYQW